MSRDRENNKCKQLVVALLLLFAAPGVFGQASAKDTTAQRAPEPKVAGADEGGWRYLGERMWYQVRKRMNMTTTEEDAAEEKKKGKDIRLKFLGMEVTKPSKKE